VKKPFNRRDVSHWMQIVAAFQCGLSVGCITFPSPEATMVNAVFGVVFVILFCNHMSYMAGQWRGWREGAENMHRFYTRLLLTREHQIGGITVMVNDRLEEPKR